MFGTITTVAAIALAHAVVRPTASKDEGWSLRTTVPSMFTEEMASTDQLIFVEAAYIATSNTPQYSASTQAGSKIASLMAELASYGEFEAGWDGEGSEPPDFTHIGAAGRILSLLPAGLPLPAPMLSADGEIGLYWKTSDYLADAVIESPSQFSLFIRSLKDGNREIYIPVIAINADASGAVAEAFRAA